MNSDPRIEALLAADPTLASSCPLLPRFLAAAEAAGLLPALKTGALNRGQLVALLRTFDPKLPVRIDLGGVQSAPGRFRTFPFADDAIVLHGLPSAGTGITNGQLTGYLAALAAVPRAGNPGFMVADKTPVRLGAAGGQVISWQITGVTEREDALWILTDETPAAPDRPAGFLNRGDLAALLDTFNPDHQVRATIDGVESTPDRFSEHHWEESTIAINFDGDHLTVAEFANRLRALTKLRIDYFHDLEVTDTTGVRFKKAYTDSSRSWVITGATETDGTVWLTVQEVN